MDELLLSSAAAVRRALPMHDTTDATDATCDAFALLSGGGVTLPTRLRLDAPAELGDVVPVKIPGHTAVNDTTLFRSVPVGIQDLCAALCGVESARHAACCSPMATAQTLRVGDRSTITQTNHAP
jgi:hypothetical protein